MLTVLDTTNLLGDSIYLLRPVERFIEMFPDDVACIVTNKGIAGDIFENCFADKVPVLRSMEEATQAFPSALKVNLSAGKAGEIAYDFCHRPGGRQLHISEGYSQMLGIPFEKSITPSKNWFSAENAEKLPPCILISPFSASCSFHTSGVRNKTLEDWKWEHIIRYLRKFNLPIKVLSGPKDILKCSIPLDDYVTAGSLYDLELWLRSCKLLVTIDNGIGHVAACLDTPMISIWSRAASLDFIGPVYGKRTTFLMMQEPSQTAPVALMIGLRAFSRMLIHENYVRVS